MDELEQLRERVRHLEEAVYWRERLFYKAFAVTGFVGDYVEFGVFRGQSLADAYWCFRRHYDIFMSGAWDHATPDPAGMRAAVERDFAAMRFIGFDSFEGLPPAQGVDAENLVFHGGTYAAGQDVVKQLLARQNVNLEQTRFVKGFFDKTCNDSTARELGLKAISVAHIDSDLYESAVTALNFCTPYFRNGSVVIFDEWFQFSGHPNYGEQRAFKEWRERHPEWHVAELGREGMGRMGFVLNRT